MVLLSYDVRVFYGLTCGIMQYKVQRLDRELNRVILVHIHVGRLPLTLSESSRRVEVVAVKLVSPAQCSVSFLL